MFEYLAGELTRKTPTEAVVECAGVGYRLSISLQTFSALVDSGPVRLLTHAHYSENDQRLYGFATDSERKLFRLLQGVRGIGPALAMTVLSHESSEQIVQRLKSGDVTGLTRIKGIGRKTAERLLVELKDRLPQLTSAPIGDPSLESIVQQALGNLGVTPSEAADRARQVLAAHPGEQRVEVLLREALRQDARSAAG